MRRKVVACLVAAASFALCCASPAAAAPTWLSAQPLGSGATVEIPDVALNENGDAAAAWIGADGVVRAAYRPAGGLFTVAAPLSPLGPVALNAHVAIDASGGVLVVWQLPGPMLSSPHTIQAAVRLPGAATFQPTGNVSPVADDSRRPQVAMDPNGNAIVVWLVGDDVVSAAVRPAGQGFIGPFTVAPVGASARAPQVAMDPAGNAVVIWTDISKRVRVSMRRIGSSFASASFPASPTTVSPTQTFSVADAQVTMSAAGDATAVWQRTIAANQREIHSATSVGGAAFGPVVLVSPSGQDLSSPQVGMDAAGNAVAVWQRDNGPNYSVQSSYRTGLGGTFAARADLPAAGPFPQEPLPQVGMSATGAAVSTWLGHTGLVAIVQVVAKPSSNGVFGVSENVSAADSNANPSQLAVDRDGDAAVAWVRGNVVELAGFDAAGPQLRGLTGPATGVARLGTAWAVTPLDVWSTVQATDWSFGDGGAASGNSVVHTYGAAGTYTVTVTARDALGNASSATRSIVVGPPLDEDGDGSNRPADCNDQNASIHPGALDRPRDGIDADCDLVDPDFPPIGSAVFDSFDFHTRYTTFPTLSVRPGKAGSTIRVRCTGGGCRFTSKTQQVPNDTARVTLDSLVRSMKLRRGTELEIRVTKPETYGAVRILTVRRGKRPTTVDLCLDPTKTAPQSCDKRPVPVLRIESAIVHGFAFSPRYTVFPRLSVRPGLPGSTIRVRCSGRGCRFKTKTRAVKRYTNIVVLNSMVRSSKIRPGGKLEIRVTKPGKIGIVRTLTVRAGKRPLQVDRCVAPGASKTSKCTS